MDEVLKKFGKYFLLDHIAQGGMAEIYRARLAAAGGASRLMVIKKIQAGYGANSEFLQMFKSEIKVTMGFNHPNIVQLYDFGEEEGQPFIAMELVDGKNLRQFQARFVELKQTFPVEIAAYITEQSALGLQYAHSFRDKVTGEHLNIVHRDISPQNILISFEGNVKVIDFGIAKASTNSESTRAGVIKGKPSYLSPEQISGEVLDGRSDLFALGAVLWELLTGKKLFAGENDLAVLKLIESCQTHVKPPSTLNPKVPKELDYIVLKCLTKQADKRYQSAEELQRALHKFLNTYMPEFNPADLAYYARDLFKNEIVEDRKKIQKLNDKVEILLSTQVSHEIAPPPSDSTDVEMDTPRAPQGSRGHTMISLENVEKATVEVEPTNTSSLIRPPGTGSYSSGSISARTPRPSQAPQQRPARAPVSPDSSLNKGKIALIAIPLVAVLSLVGPEFGVRVPILSNLFSDLLSGSEARLILEGEQKGVVVAINGQTVASAVPTTLSGLLVGTPFRLTVTGPNGSFQQELILRKGEKKTLPITLTPEKPGSVSAASSAPALGEKSILLKLNLIPGGGTPNMTISGRTVDPGTGSLQVPLDSPLELVIDRPGFKAFKREFVLESRQLNGLKESLMDVQLEPMNFGFLTIHTIPSSDAFIPLESGSPWKRKTPMENEKLPTGHYRIRLVNEVLGMEKTVELNIEEGKATNINEKLEIQK